MTLVEFGKKIEEIRAAADCVEIKGSQNRKLISYIVDTCNGLIKEINSVIQQVGSNEMKEGDPNGSADTGKPKQD